MDQVYQVGDVVSTTEGSAVVHRIYSDGELELSFPEYTSPDELFTMAPEDVSPCSARRQSSHRTSSTIVEVPRSTKRRRSSHNSSAVVADVPRLVKRQRFLSKIVVDLPRSGRTSTYTKDQTGTVSKTEQNTAFLRYLCSLNIPVKKLQVLVLDTSILRTTRMLLAAGLLPSHIYIPQPDEVEATRMLEQCPTLRVFAGLKAGDLIWKMADRNIKFHGALLDYCGAPGQYGRKNTPMDDLANLFRYKLLSDTAVLTQTVCARSHVRTFQKYAGFKAMRKSIRTYSRLDKRRLYKAKEIIYTDPGSQTMCHFRCILQKTSGSTK